MPKKPDRVPSPPDRTKTFLLLTGEWIGDHDQPNHAFLMDSLMAPSEVFVRELAAWMVDEPGLFANVKLARITETELEVELE